MRNEQALITYQDLIENPTPRVPVALCLDVSGSMFGQPIDELNEGIRLFCESVIQDEIAKYAAEICVVTFGDEEARLVQDFTAIDSSYLIPELYASGYTPMGEAVNIALDAIERRKQEYKNNGVDYYQPWLVVMTDGYPNGNQIELYRAVSRTSSLADNKKLTVFPIAIGNNADIDVLKKLSPKRNPLKLKGLNFKEFFAWLSSSVSRTSQSMPGEQIKLDIDSLKGWAEL